MILCSGCFDGLHAGHVRYLHEARKLDPRDRLVVAVAHDEYVGDSKDRVPLWPQWQRVETVAALRDVDEAFGQPPGSVAQVVLSLKPRLFVKGIDWRDCLPPDVRDACEAVGAQIVYVAAELHGHVEEVLEAHVQREIVRRGLT